MSRPRLSEAPYVAALLVALFLFYLASWALTVLPPITLPGEAGPSRKDLPMLAGYKTYIVAGLTVIGAGAAYLMGESSVQDAVQLAVTAILGATIRHGVSTGA